MQLTNKATYISVLDKILSVNLFQHKIPIMLLSSMMILGGAIILRRFLIARYSLSLVVLLCGATH